MTGIITKTGKHHKHDDLEYWPEDGLIYIEDRRNGDFNVITCRDFALRARAINEEAKKASYKCDRDKLNGLVIDMHEAWKEAKQQGDPMDVAVAKTKHRERRKAILVTGMW